MSQELFGKLESDFGLPSGILDAVWATESARGKNMKSPVGAEGHFQFMPATAKEVGVKNPYDLTDAATGAAKYLSGLMKQFNGNVELALAAYNAGPGNVQKYGGVPPFAETQQYVKKVRTAMDGDIPSPKFDGIPTPKFAGGDAKDWQSELDEQAGVWTPALAGIIGGMAGGAAGSFGGPVGTAIGGTAGGMLGSSLAIVNNIRDHPAPIEEKLKFLAKQGLIDLATSAGIGMTGKVIRPLISKLSKTPQEVKDAEKFFADRGFNLTPQVKGGAKGGVNVYRDAAETMSETVDDAITLIRRQMASARTPDELGRELANGKVLYTQARRDYADAAYSPFKAGGSWGTGLADMTPVADEATAMLKEIGKGWEQAFGNVKPRTISILEEAAGFAGKGDDVAGLVAKRRQLQDAIEDEGKALSLDNARKVRLFKAIDDRVEEALKAHPDGDKAVRAYRNANLRYREMSTIIESELVANLAKKDPMLAAQELGKMASPTSVREFTRVLDEFVKTGTVARNTAEEILNTARASWITNNFRKLGSVASLHPTHKDFDAVGREGFNALFANSPFKSDMLQIANNAKVIEDMLVKLPNRGDHVPAGAYSLAAAAGSVVAGSPGAVSAMTGVWSATHIPQMLAHAAVSGDKGLINAIKFVTTWSAKNAPSTMGQGAGRGVLFGVSQAAVPPAVMQAMDYIDKKARDLGILK